MNSNAEELVFDFATDDVQRPVDGASWAKNGVELVSSLMATFVVHGIHSSGLFRVKESCW